MPSETDKPSENDREFYSQRFETFRHLDRMRFQLLQILVALGAAIALFYRFNTTPLEWWAFVLIGIVLFLIGWNIRKVSDGLRSNNAVLHGAGIKVGDHDVPLPKSKCSSVWYWISGVVLALSGVSILIGLCKAGNSIF